VRKIFRLLTAVFVVTLIPVAFDADGQPSPWSVEVVIQDGCAQDAGPERCDGEPTPFRCDCCGDPPNCKRRECRG
jgi:hypothetical protein